MKRDIPVAAARAVRGSRGLGLALTAMVLGTTLTTTAMAADASEQGTIAAAQDALAAGDAATARDILVQRVESDTASTNDFFLLGLAQKRLGEHQAAITQFEEVLSRAPDSPRVELELAESQYALGRLDEARERFDRVRQTEPPTPVTRRIEAYLAAIDNRQRHWRITATAGVLYDSNVNAGPDTDTVELFGLPFRLSDDSRESSDWAATATVNVGYQRPLNDTVALDGGFRLDYRDYRDIDDFDSLEGSAWLGPAWRMGRASVAIPLVASAIRLGHDADYYQRAIGIAPRVTYAIDRQWAVTARTVAQDVHYHDNEAADGELGRVDASLSYRPTRGWRLGVGVYASREDSGLDTRSHTRRGARVSLNGVITPVWRISASLDHAFLKYDDSGAFFVRDRKAHRSHVNTSVTRRFPSSGLDVVLDLSYTRNDSSIGLYDYDRYVAGARLIKRF